MNPATTCLLGGMINTPIYRIPAVRPDAFSVTSSLREQNETDHNPLHRLPPVPLHLPETSHIKAPAPEKKSNFFTSPRIKTVMNVTSSRFPAMKNATLPGHRVTPPPVAGRRHNRMSRSEREELRVGVFPQRKANVTDF